MKVKVKKKVKGINGGYVMNKWIMSVILLALFVCVSVVKSDAITVQSIIGSQVNCDIALSGCTPIRVAVSSVCTAGCPALTTASYTNSTRFYGNSLGGVDACRTSTDSGATWGACTTQPFAGGIGNGNGEQYSTTANGSIIAVAVVTVGTTCTFKRSIDNAVSWTTTYTGAGDNCIYSVGGVGQTLICISSGACEFVAVRPSGAPVIFKTFRSSDNGQSWTAGETSIGVSSGNYGTAWNGTAGVSLSRVAAGSYAVYKAVADAWTLAVPWAQAGTDCTNAVVYNGVGRVNCVTATTWTLREADGTVVGNYSLVDAGLGANNGGVSYSPKTNILYVTAQKSTSQNVGIYVSIDNLSSFNLIGTIVSGSSLVSSGNSYEANGCIYFSLAGAINALTKVC